MRCAPRASNGRNHLGLRALQAAFPAGIEIVTTADYFSLGQRSNAFLHVMPAVAAMHDDYGPHLAHHLATNKLQHWEQSLRQLAAEVGERETLPFPARPLPFCQRLTPLFAAPQALGKLAFLPSTRAALAGEVFASLLPQCTDRLIPVRHGAVRTVVLLTPPLHLY